MPADTVKHAPERIWATVNGMSTRLPDGHRQFIGGWSEDPTRDRVTEYVRADLVDRAIATLREAIEVHGDDYSWGSAAKVLIAKAEGRS